MNSTESFIQIATTACQPLIQKGWAIGHTEGIRGMQMIVLNSSTQEYRIAYEYFETPALHRYENGRIAESFPVNAKVLGGQGGILSATHEEQLSYWLDAAISVIAELTEKANKSAHPTAGNLSI